MHKKNSKTPRMARLTILKSKISTNDDLISNLDESFAKLIKKDTWLFPKKFFSIKWNDCEEFSIYRLYAHISFLNRFSQEKRDLYLLKYSLQHLSVLVNYFCKNSHINEIQNTLIKLTITGWDLYPEEQLDFAFFITYKCHTLFGATKPFVQPYTKQALYIIELLKELNIADDYFVYDDHPPIDPEMQRVSVGLKKHLNPNLITLDHFV